MQPLQLALIVLGVVCAIGGMVMLVTSRNRSSSERGPYVPLAMTFIGLIISYRAYIDYSTLDPLDIVIMGLFVLALLSILGVQFFVIDKSNRK